ncbi:hypothetical protein XELAEV_18012901mg, partial [Xenopus laevis]
YALKCPCGLMYVGQTTRPLKDRVGEHKSDIMRKVKQSPVAQHFIEVGHSVSQLRFQVLQQVLKPRRGGDRIKLLLKCESSWICRLETLSPKSMNKEYDLSTII